MANCSLHVINGVTLYVTDLEIKDKTESNAFVYYLDLFLSTGPLHISLYDKRDDFRFFILQLAIRELEYFYTPFCSPFIYSLHDMPGIAPLMNVLFWELCDFQIRS